ncbi:hypothetical protein PRZ48_011091 [Zasmidium cellare]|uniref:Secretory lipase-domain-containing protein n=1 Tax=Zasmidium cellare TaxID=395010 RepID=A0ABR0EBC5_ZASCE|nr:hypothetical protein PRZ48_011091 [Zasmidium cellare]
MLTGFVLLLASTATAVLLPSQDAFYTQPANISSYAPGDVISSRSIPTNLNGLLSGGPSPSIKAAYQYSYRTTDSLGNAIAAVTTLLVPYGADPSKLLAYQTAYDSANNDCSPSYAFQAGANTSATSDIIFITAALNQGWYVLSPDYEGLQAHYTSGLISGYATLDSVRAAFKQTDTSGLSSSAKYAMWGYSGGSLASEWAAELQPTYAPELHFEGTALGGLIPNVQDVLSTINGGPFAGLAFSGIFGLSKAYPELANFLDSNLVPAKKDQFYTIANGCLSQASSQGAFQDLYSYFRTGKASISQPVPQSVLAKTGIMGTHGVPSMPLFVYKAVGDEVSPSVDTDNLVKALCSKGASIEYHKDVVGEHITEAVTGSANALAWISDRLDGKAASEGCSTEVVALTAVDLESVEQLGGELVALLQDLLGGKLGPAFSG